MGHDDLDGPVVVIRDPGDDGRMRHSECDGPWATSTESAES